MANVTIKDQNGNTLSVSQDAWNSIYSKQNGKYSLVQSPSAAPQQQQPVIPQSIQTPIQQPPPQSTPSGSVPPGYEKIDGQGLSPDTIKKKYGTEYFTRVENGVYVAYGKPDPEFAVRYHNDGSPRRTQTYPDGSMLDLDTKEVVRQPQTAGGVTGYAEYKPQSGNIPFRAGLSATQQSSITALAQKPSDQWTATDKANWAYATNNSPVPSTLPGNAAPTPSTTFGAGSSGASNLNGAQVGGSTPNIDQAGWTDSMKQTYDAMTAYVQKLTSNGQIVNPDIKIDDSTIQRFTQQAKTELSPYYGQLFSQAEADLKTASDTLSQNYNKNVRDIGVQYGNQLQNTQEDLASRGLGLGQYRDQQEQKIADSAQRSLQDAADSAANSAKNTGTSGERLLGSANINSYNPTITTGQTLQNGPGQYGLTSGNGSRTLFSSVGNTTGTLQANQTNAEATRVQDLTNNERQLRALNYA